MLYTEKEKNEIERVRKVFEKHLQQMTGYDLVWSDKVGYVWLAISIDPIYIDTGNWIESAASLCYECLNDILNRRYFRAYLSGYGNGSPYQRGTVRK